MNQYTYSVTPRKLNEEICEILLFANKAMLHTRDACLPTLVPYNRDDLHIHITPSPTLIPLPREESSTP